VATNFPTSADDATTVGGDSKPAAGTALSDSTAGHPSHSDLHENVGDAVQAVEAKVGTGSSTPAANTVLTGTGSGTSGWATVATAMIADDAVTAAKLASNAVVTASIVDDNVTQAKIADDAVGADQLASDAVVTASIVDDAVTAAKIHDDAVTKVVVADTTDTSCSVALFESATGSLPPKTDGGLTYNAGTGALTATGFVGPLTGNVTGDVTGTLQTAAQANITSVGTLTSLTVGGDVDINGLVKVNDGSASAPTFTFDSDEGNGMYLGTTDEINFATNGAKRVAIGNELFYLEDGVDFFAFPNTGSGNDAEWVATGFGNYELKRNSSLRAEKENIQDLGDELTANMIDQVEPKLWNRIHSPGIPEIGPIAEDMEAISPHLGAHGFNEDGTTFLTGINKTTYLSLLVLAVKDIRTRLAALEG